MKHIEKVIWAIMLAITFFFIQPIRIYGLLLFMVFHELGHAFSSACFGAFRGFGIYGVSFATRINMDVIPEYAFNFNFASGMMMNILTMSIVMPFFPSSDVLWYMVIVLGCGAGDIYCMIKRKPFKSEQTSTDE